MWVMIQTVSWTFW